jgi:hypothetical protein
MINIRTYERRDMDNLSYEEAETSSIMRIKKEDGDKKSNANSTFHTEQADTVLYLREINKYCPLNITVC